MDKNNRANGLQKVEQSWNQLKTLTGSAPKVRKTHLVSPDQLAEECYYLRFHVVKNTQFIENRTQ